MRDGNDKKRRGTEKMGWSGAGPSLLADLLLCYLCVGALKGVGKDGLEWGGGSGVERELWFEFYNWFFGSCVALMEKYGISHDRNVVFKGVYLRYTLSKVYDCLRMWWRIDRGIALLMFLRDS